MKLAPRRNSLAYIAISGLLMATLCAADGQASWFYPKCKFSCTQEKCTKDSKTLNECAANCNPSSIMECLLPNCTQLSQQNWKRFKPSVESELKKAKEDRSKMVVELWADRSPEDSSKKKKLRDKKAKLDAAVKTLENTLQKCSGINAETDIHKLLPQEKPSSTLQPLSNKDRENVVNSLQTIDETENSNEPESHTSSLSHEDKEKKEQQTEPSTSQPPSLLDQIQKGKQLKKVEPNVHKDDSSTTSEEGSLQNALANAMKNRRGAMHEDKDHQKDDFEENNFD